MSTAVANNIVKVTESDLGISGFFFFVASSWFENVQFSECNRAMLFAEPNPEWFGNRGNIDSPHWCVVSCRVVRVVVCWWLLVIVLFCFLQDQQELVEEQVSFQFCRGADIVVALAVVVGSLNRECWVFSFVCLFVWQRTVERRSNEFWRFARHERRSCATATRIWRKCGCVRRGVACCVLLWCAGCVDVTFLMLFSSRRHIRMRTWKSWRTLSTASWRKCARSLWTNAQCVLLLLCVLLTDACCCLRSLSFCVF